MRISKRPRNQRPLTRTHPSREVCTVVSHQTSSKSTDFFPNFPPPSSVILPEGNQMGTTKIDNQCATRGGHGQTRLPRVASRPSPASPSPVDRDSKMDRSSINAFPYTVKPRPEVRENARFCALFPPTQNGTTSVFFRTCAEKPPCGKRQIFFLCPRSEFAASCD